MTNRPKAIGTTAEAPSVCGLDLSLTGTGIATRTGTLTVKPGDLRGLSRLAYIRGYVCGAVDGCTLVAVEGPAYSRALGAGHHEAAGLWWMVASDLTTAGLRVIVVPPSVLKKYATGRGNATKADMRVALLTRTGFDLRDDNQVDATWLRYLGLDYLGHPVLKLPADQHLAVNKVARLAVT